MSCLLLLLFVLKFVLSDLSIASLDFFWFSCAWNIFFCSFTFFLCPYMRSLLWRHTDESFFFLIHSATVLDGVFRFGNNLGNCLQPYHSECIHLRAQMLSRVGPSQYLNGRPPGSTWCCRLKRAEPWEDLWWWLGGKSRQAS